MSARIRSHLSYSNVVSTLCLFALLGGGAYAANKITAKDLAKNSVKSKAIKNGQVKSKDIKKNAVKGKQLADGGITGADLGAGSVGPGALAPGSVGSAAIAPGSVNSAAITDGGVGAADLAPDEQVHIVGAPGEPTLGNGGNGDCVWSAASSSLGGSIEPVNFYKDARGRVHFSGTVIAVGVAGVGDEECGATSPETDDSAEDGRILVLPPAYRPAKSVVVPGISSGGFGSGAYLVAGEQGLAIGPTVLLPGTVYAPPGEGAQQSMGNSWLAGDSSVADPLGRSAADRPELSPEGLRQLLGG